MNTVQKPSRQRGTPILVANKHLYPSVEAIEADEFIESQERLYDCFTEDELSRVQAIKSHPDWTPRSQRDGYHTGRAGICYNQQMPGERIALNIYVSQKLRDRFKAYATDRGISMSALVEAMMEALLS